MPRNVNVPPQKVWGSIPLQLPLVKMSEAESIYLYGQPQIYDKNYPLDFDGLGLNPPYWAGTGVGGELNGLGDVGGGNIRLMPWEKGNGFSGLGATAAQTAAARRLAAQQAAAQRKADADAKRLLTQQATAQKRADALATAKKKADNAAAQRILDQQTAKQKRDDATAAAAQKKLDAANTKTQNATNAANARLQQQCTAGGGTWNSSTNVCTTQQQACTAAGNYWNGTQCVGKPQQDCVSKGGTWDVNTGVCTALPATATCPAAPTSCQPGYIIGVDTNNCPVCVVDPNATSPQASQCQSSGGYWNGSNCLFPAQNQQSYPPQSYPGAGAPPPPMDFGGGGGGGGFPMMQSPQGMGPQLNDQANMFAPPVPPPAPVADDTQQDTGTSDDSSTVADTNIFESISKLFSGMSGLACGCDAPPPRFSGMGYTPDQIQYFNAMRAEPIKSSTTAAVVGGALVLMVGAAAVFLWSKGKK